MECRSARDLFTPAHASLQLVDLGEGDNGDRQQCQYTWTGSQEGSHTHNVQKFQKGIATARYAEVKK